MGYSNPLDTYLCFHYRPLILLQPISPEIEVTFGLVCHCVNSYSPPTNYWIYYCGHIRLLTRFNVPWAIKGSVNTNLTRFKVPWAMKGSVNTNLTRFKVPWTMKGLVNTTQLLTSMSSINTLVLVVNEFIHSCELVFNNNRWNLYWWFGQKYYGTSRH